MSNSKRMQRLCEAYKKELSQIILYEMRDPRLHGAYITTVVFTPDLRLAKIYFNASGGRVREPEILEGFESSKGFLRRELSDRVEMKFSPDLKFYFDESSEEKDRIDRLFDQLERQKNEESEKH